MALPVLDGGTATRALDRAAEKITAGDGGSMERAGRPHPSPSTASRETPAFLLNPTR